MTTLNARSDMTAVVNIETSWAKYLEMLPHFTIKEFEQHRLLVSKTLESAIIKTLDRFKDVRYITSDSTFTKCDNVKGLCKASMKKEKRSVAVKLSTTTSKVIDDSCSRQAVSIVIM